MFKAAWQARWLDGDVDAEPATVPHVSFPVDVADAATRAIADNEASRNRGSNSI